MSDSESLFEKTVKKDECALLTERWGRKLAYPLAMAAHKVGLSANHVTLIAGLSWFLSSFVLIFASHLLKSNSVWWASFLYFLVSLMWVAGYILDIADGSLARMTDSSSFRGFYFDYIFHLLFKPAFAISLSISLYIVYGGLIWLMIGLLALASNWTTAESSSEHVICEALGKGSFNISTLEEESKKQLFLGTTDIKASVEDKQQSWKSIAVTLMKEILSYYGQSVFFALVLLVDITFNLIFGTKLFFTAIAFVFVFAMLIVRLPYRIKREFNRIKIMDDKDE